MTTPCYSKVTRTRTLAIEALLVRREDGDDDEWMLFWHQIGKPSEVSSLVVRVRQTPGRVPSLAPSGRGGGGMPYEVLAAFGEIVVEEWRARAGQVGGALLESAAARDSATLATYPTAITRSPRVHADGVDIVERRSTAREIRAAIAREMLPVPGQWITIEEFTTGVSAGLTVQVRLGP